MQYLLLLHGSSGYVNALQCYVMHALRLLFICIAMIAEECKYNSPERCIDLCIGLQSALLDILRFSCGNNILLSRITEGAVATRRIFDMVCIVSRIFILGVFLFTFVD
jgi:hypothetical protein